MAGKGAQKTVKLFEHPDFDQAIIRAAEYFRPRGLRESIIEKDYFVTEALRIIEADYDRISTHHFPKSYVPPPDMSFAKSDAMFPPAELPAVLGSEFEAQCRVLCFGPFADWDHVQATFEGIREYL